MSSIKITVPAVALMACAMCAAKETTRPYLNGVCVEVWNNEYRLIATDGCRMIG